jgi:hypothetical protein
MAPKQARQPALLWERGENTIIAALNEKIVELMELVKQQGLKIEKLENGGNSRNNTNDKTNTEWRDMLVGKIKKTESQITILNAVGNEQSERKFRENNVILFGVPASSGTTAKDQEKDDEKKAIEILQTLSLHKDHVLKVTRFKVKPTNNTNKPAPIRVEFDQDYTIVAMDVVKRAKSLKDSDEHSNVFVALDLTPSQIYHQKYLVKTRNEQNKKLEVDNRNLAKNTRATYRYGIRNNMVVKTFFKV